MFRRVLLWAVLSWAVPAVAIAADAAWRADGIPIGDSLVAQFTPVAHADDAGGAYVGWSEEGYCINMLQLSSMGTAAPGWRPQGLGNPERPVGLHPTVVADGAGGAWVAWSVGLMLEFFHVSPGGVITGRPAGAAGRSPAGAGTALSDRGLAGPADAQKQPEIVQPTLVADGSDGAYLIWQYHSMTADLIQLGRLAANGAPDPSWPWALEMDTSYYPRQESPVGCSDGAGGIVVVWRQWNRIEGGMDILAARVTRQGAIAPGWARTGTTVCGASGDQDAPGVVADGAGGALIAWRDARDGAEGQIFAHRFTSSGEPAPGWPSDGIRICRFPTVPGLTRHDRFTMVYSSVASDGAGGMFIAWSDLRADAGDIYCQHVLPDGSIAPGWPEDGAVVCTAPGAQEWPTLSADDAGGAVLTWQDHRGATDADVYAARLTADGVMAPVWTANGVAVCTQAGAQTVPSIAAAPGGAAIVAWQDERCGPPRIFVSRLAGDGTAPTGDPVSPPARVSGLGSEAGPSGVRVAWQVAGESDAIEVHRAGRDGSWRTIATVAPDATGRLAVTDSMVGAGCSYGYRLGLVICGVPRTAGEMRVDVPAGAGIPGPTGRVLSANAADGQVKVDWQFTTRDLDATEARVQRRDLCGAWTTTGALPDSQGAINHRESGLFEGRRCGYRLVLETCGREEVVGETWLDIPPNQGFLRESVEPIQGLVEEGAAKVGWHVVAGPWTAARLYRQLPGADWTAIATRRINVPADLRFADPNLPLGAHIGYRLGLREEGPACAGPETSYPPLWIDTPTDPSASPAHRLDLRAQASPALDVPQVLIDLSTSETAPLECFDLRGRLVWSRDVGSLGPGSHPVRLTELGSLPPGVYLLRLRQLGQVRTVRLAVLR